MVDMRSPWEDPLSPCELAEIKVFRISKHHQYLIGNIWMLRLFLMSLTGFGHEECQVVENQVWTKDNIAVGGEEF